MVCSMMSHINKFTLSLVENFLKTCKFMEKIIKMRSTFSIEFKKEKVLLIEQGKLKVSEVSKMYEVTQTAVYKWLLKYSKSYP